MVVIAAAGAGDDDGAAAKCFQPENRNGAVPIAGILARVDRIDGHLLDPIGRGGLEAAAQLRIIGEEIEPPLALS